MKLLFITRTYPPLVGGMEKFASDFYNNYREVGEIDLLANPGGRKTILSFIIKVVIVLAKDSRRYDIIHFYDAVLSPLIFIVRLFSKAKVSFTVNGLDVVYSRFGYQKIIPFFLKRADRVIGISQYTVLQCKLRGIQEEKLTFIPIGINGEELYICSEFQKAELRSKFNIPSHKKILLTVGRLVERKGHSWFIENVIKNLPEEFIYLIAGQGPQEDTILRTVQELGLNDRVFLLGRISEEDKNCLYQLAELFVMPNITIKNDQEGFGIVILEAGRFGVPVIASNIEGLSDAVINGKTGILVEEMNAGVFIDKILRPDINRSFLAETVTSSFDWKNIIKKYNEEFEKIRGEQFQETYS